MQENQETHRKSRLPYNQIINLGDTLASLGTCGSQNIYLKDFIEENFGGECFFWLKDSSKSYFLSTKQKSFYLDPYTTFSDELKHKNSLQIIKNEDKVWTLLPLSFSGDKIGWIIIKTNKPFSKNEISSLNAIAKVSALAIHAGLQTQLKNWRQKQLALVRSVTAQISQITEINLLTKRITDLVQETFDYYYVAIFLVNRETKRLHFKNSAGSDQSERPEFEKETHPGFALGEHMIGFVAETGQELISNNVSLEPRYQAVDSLAATKSEAVLPLKMERDILGVFDVQSDHLDAFSEEDLLVLRALADNIAIAIESTRLYQEAHNRAEQLGTVSEVSRAITYILDIDELLQKIVDLINERFNFPYVHLYTIDPVLHLLTFKAGSGGRTSRYKKAGIAYDVNAEKGILSAVVQNGKTLRINDVRSEPLFIESPFDKGFSGSEMAIPLSFGGDVLGVLDIQSEQKNAFSGEDQQLLETLADNIAISIRNARLYRSEKWRRQVAESLRDIASLLSENTDLQAVMNAILDQLHINLPCDFAGIWLFDQDQPSNLPIESRALRLSAFRTSQNVPVESLDDVLFFPDEWVKNALTTKQPKIRQVDDTIGPIGEKYHLKQDYSSIAAPLHTGDEILGMLTLIHSTPGRYGAESQKITSAFASYAAVAIENNRLFKSSQEQAWISTILLQVAQATQSLTDLDELIGTIVRITPMVVGIEGCALFLKEPNSDFFSLFDMYGIEYPQGENQFELPYPVRNASLLQDLMLTKQPLKVIAPQQELNLPLEIAKEIEESTSVLLPLISRDEVLGAFLLVKEEPKNSLNKHPQIFTDEELKIVQGIIQQTAVAIENIHLIEDRQEEAYVSTVLLQTAQAIVSSGTLNDTLDSIVSILPILVGIDASAIYLWDDTKEAFEISHAITKENRDKRSLSEINYPQGDFPMLDTVFTNNRPIVYPFLENTFPLEDWDLALPDEEQIDPTPILQTQYPLLYGFPLSVKDEVYGVLLAQDENFSINRQRRFDLLFGIAQQTSLAIQNDKLNKEMLDRQRLEREFQLAREIQQTFLPEQKPEIPGWNLDVHWETARQVGGDFYDFFLLPDGKLAVIIADVSDKGLAASLYMTVTRTLIRAAALEYISPAKALERVNELLLTNSQNGLFVTTFYGILSMESGEFFYTIAGHNPPMVVQHQSKEILELNIGGIALGALPEIQLHDHRLIINPGDCLVLYTDGVTEAFNLQDQMYGEERLKKILLATIGKKASQTLAILEKDLDDFRGDAPLSDDTTILAVCRDFIGK